MKRPLLVIGALLCALLFASEVLSRPVGRGVPGPGGAFDHRGVHDPRGIHDPRGRSGSHRVETRDARKDLRDGLRDADDRGDVRDARQDYREGVRDEFWD